MSRPLINYHMLLEFHSFLYDLANYEKEFKKHKDFSEPDDFVKGLIDETYEDLSPIMKSDLQLLFKDTVLVSYSMVAAQMITQVKDYRDFRDRLQDMDADDYIKLFILSASDEEVFGSTEEESIELIEDQLQKLDMGDTIIESYRELKKYPEQTMSRIRNFLDRFYFEYFEKAEKEIENFLIEKTERHREIYSKDQERFEKEIVKVSFDELNQEEVEYHYFVGYLNTGKQSYHKEGNRVFCYYCYQFEQLFDSSFYDKQMIELFKTLADETRLKMIRMMGEKSWYSSEMAEELGINKATVSYHMKMFTRFNIVDINLGENKRIYYRANRKNLETFFNKFTESIGEN